MKVEFVKAVKFEAKNGKYFYYIVVNDKPRFLGGDSLPKAFFVGFDYGEKLLANRNNIHKGYDDTNDREFLYIPKSRRNSKNVSTVTGEDIPF